VRARRRARPPRLASPRIPSSRPRRPRLPRTRPYQPRPGTWSRDTARSATGDAGSGVLACGRGPPAEGSVRAGVRPRLHARQQPRARVPGRARLRRLAAPARSDRGALRLAVPCVLPDAEPLPPAARDLAVGPVPRDAPLEWQLCAAPEQALRAHGPCLRGAVPDRAGRGAEPSARALPVHPAQPGSGGARDAGRGLATEQLPRHGGPRARPALPDDVVRPLALRPRLHGAAALPGVRGCGRAVPSGHVPGPGPGTWPEGTG